jgi:FKBP-type peptidyl-prolyl cis-trans isomerase
MGFFGEIVDNDEMELDVPVGYNLHISKACIDADDKANHTVLYVRTGNDERNFVICHLNKNILQSDLSLDFREEDNPITLWTKGDSKIHVTGKWDWDDDDMNSEESDNDTSDEDEDEECPQLVEINHDVKKDNKDDTKQMNKKQEEFLISNSNTKKRKMSDSDLEQSLVKVEVPIAKPDGSIDSGKRKPWNVKPVDDEGVLVMKPKQLMKSSGIIVTDYIIGKGITPKPGAKVKITYQGLFPDGTVFDKNLKRTKPFIFRNGSGDVIRGLDLGIEGMRVGGSREVVIPSELGYSSYCVIVYHFTIISIVRSP